MAEIVVVRCEGSLADRLSIYKVYIDGEHRGDLANKERRSFPVPIGAHTLKLCVDSYWLPAFKVAVLNTTKLTCRPSLAHALGMVAMTSPSSWITVQEEPDAVAPVRAPVDIDPGMDGYAVPAT